MSLKHGILGLLTYGSMTGYELMKVFNDSLTFFWNAQTSQIYRELEGIEKKGWVTSEYVIQEGKPNKKIFSISEDGKRELVDWVNNHSIKESTKFRDGMTMRVFFGGSGDTENLKNELIEYKKFNEGFITSIKHIEVTLERRADFINKPSEKIFWLMAIKKGYIIAKANIEWVDECLKIIQENGM